MAKIIWRKINAGEVYEEGDMWYTDDCDPNDGPLSCRGQFPPSAQYVSKHFIGALRGCGSRQAWRPIDLISNDITARVESNERALEPGI